MNNEKALNDLQVRIDSLKSQLSHEQLKCDNFSFRYFEKYSLLILNEYKKHKSLFKASSIVGIDYSVVMNWYMQGQLNNPMYRGFYLSINDLNDNSAVKEEIKNISEIGEDQTGLEGDFIISQYGDGWSYKTFIDGEKIFIISNDLKTLKKKVRDKRLPLD